MPLDEGTGSRSRDSKKYDSRRVRAARKRAGVKKTYTVRGDSAKEKGRVAVQGRARDIADQIQVDKSTVRKKGALVRQDSTNIAKQRMAQIQALGLSDAEKKDLQGYTRASSQRTQSEAIRGQFRKLDEGVQMVTGIKPSDAAWSYTNPVDRLTDRTRRGQTQVAEGPLAGGWVPEDGGMAGFAGFGLNRIGAGVGRVLLRDAKKVQEVDSYLDEVVDEGLDVNEWMARRVAPKELPEPKAPRTSKFGEIINVPRALRASMDISAPFRQGLVLAARHPVMFAREWEPMIKALLSEKNHAKYMKQIKDRPTYDLMRKRLQLTDLDDPLLAREENLIGMDYAERLRVVGRGVRASGRAYVTFLNKFRADAFDNYLMMAKKRGLDVSGTTQESKKLLDDIASWVNHSTGRGTFKKIEGEAALLNGLFFSPRLMLSRLQLLNPVYYGKLSPFAREQALKGAGALLGEVAFTLYMAKAAGADVQLDPRSSDFGKIKIGDTRIDIMGGLQQYAVLYSRLITRQTVNEHGEVTDLAGGYAGRSPFDVGIDFLENKAAPVTGYGIDALKQETGVGEPFRPVRDAARQFIPLGWESTYEGFQENPGAGIAAATLGPVGFGVQTYPKQNKAKPRGAQGRLEAKINKELKEELRHAKKIGRSEVPESVVAATTLKAKVDARLAVLQKEQRTAKNAQIPEGERLKLTPRQRYAATIKAFRDYVPNFDYESAEARMDSLTDKGFDVMIDRFRAYYYGDLLERWHALR